VNLPMLLKLSTARTEGAPLLAIAELIASYGQKNIIPASQLLRSRVEKGRTQ
jgi:PTS system mannose-specific IIA component